MGIIYKATNKVSGMVYIGKSKKTLVARQKQHIKDIKKGSNLYFHNVLRKHPNEFDWNILVIAENNLLSVLEIQIIALYKNRGTQLYNRTVGGDGFTGKHSIEWKQKMAERVKGNKYRLGQFPSLETREKLSKSKLGNTNAKTEPHTEEHKTKISESMKGKKNALGKGGWQHGEETRQKISVANKGRKLSEEHKLKLKKAHTGKTLTDETKAKMSAVRKGRKFSKEHGQKISNALRGRTVPLERRLRISNTLKQRNQAKKNG